jgi:hypothetical protein
MGDCTGVVTLAGAIPLVTLPFVSGLTPVARLGILGAGFAELLGSVRSKFSAWTVPLEHPTKINIAISAKKIEKRRLCPRQRLVQYVFICFPPQKALE